MIKIEMLRAFVEVARAGNLVTGARLLGRTPSAVSMTLKNLEEHLGQPLFESERKSRLTPLGAFVLEMAERELTHFARTLNAIENYASARSGEIRIASVPSFAGTTLPAITREFMRRHPEVRMDIHDLDSASILRELERGHVDLGIVSSGREHPEFRRISLGLDPFGLVVPADDPLADRARIPWAEAIELPLIANPLCEQIDVPELRKTISAGRLRVHNATTLIGMVRAGLGVTVLPKLVMRNASPGLAFVHLEEPVVERELHLLLRAQDTPSPAVSAFADLVATWPNRGS